MDLLCVQTIDAVAPDTECNGRVDVGFEERRGSGDGEFEEEDGFDDGYGERDEEEEDEGSEE
jgi:hypothetical protein